MKKKIYKIWGVGLALVLAITLSLGVAVPAGAADYPENDWAEWGTAAIDVDTDVGAMAITPDGVIYAAVYDDTSGDWMVQMSEDNGFTWDTTDLDDADGPISQIVVSPNYDEDGTVYVAVYNAWDDDGFPYVWFIENDGADAYQLKSIEDDGDVATYLVSIDVWYDENSGNNLILAGTDIDVFLLEHTTTGAWINQDLGHPGYEVNFAPDFDDPPHLMWALTDDGDDFILTSTISPGMWGQFIGEADFGIDSTIWADLDFPDDYSSDPDDLPVVFAALSSSGNGGVYMVECVDADDGDSTATELMDDDDMVSLAISGEVILAGSNETPCIYRSENLGDTWSAATKSPTGEGWTHVYMAPGDFDEDDGVAYASTFGDESAVSRSTDGGDIWNQISIIDTTIDDINDIAFHPDFPSTPTFLMVTYSSSQGTYSLWLTENGDSDAPDYMRVLCGYLTAEPGNFDGEFVVVEYSSDAEVILLGGWDTSEYIVWKSTNGGQTFGTPRDVDSWIYDIASPDGSTILLATDTGIYRSVNKGLSWSNPVTTGAYTVVTTPNDEDAFLVGGLGNGNVSLSTDSGATFDTVVTADTGLDGDVVVAFDPGFADGEGAIYAADDNGHAVLVGDEDLDFDNLEDDTNGDAATGNFTGLAASTDNALYVISQGSGGAAGTDQVVDAEGSVTLEGDTSSSTDTSTIDEQITAAAGEFDNGEVLSVTGSALTYSDITDNITGTIVLEGVTSGATGQVNTIDVSVADAWGTEGETVSVIGFSLLANETAPATGAVAGTDTGLYRLLLGEDDSIWETADDSELVLPAHAWLTSGSNVVWTIDDDDAEVWVISDTLSGQVTLDSPADGFRSDDEDSQLISWNALTGADEYEYDCDSTGTTSSTSKNISGLASGTEYTWKARVAPGEPWSSRWSDSRTFHTALGAPSWAPTLYAPGNGATGTSLLPAFSWETATGADGYQFQLNDSPVFATLVDTNLTTEAYQVTTELEYGTTYYWRVRALKGDDAISRWSEVAVFTTMEEPAAPTTPVTTTTTTQAPAPIVLPTAIPPALLWTIIGIGAALIIAVIVLIVRTRRAV